MNRLGTEGGMTLVEVLLVSVLMIVVLGATLTTLSSFQGNVKANEDQNAAQDETRAALDLMARDLRNLASPTPNLPEAVDVDLPQDVIFQSEGKEKPAGSLNAQNTTRVRYCLNPTTDSLWRQTQVWTAALAPPIPDASTCPGGGWDRSIELSTHVVNDTRPIFTYNSPNRTEITEVSSQLFVDANPARRPTEVTLQTVVYLRNQNRAPTAVFTWAPMPGGGVFLNASESTDPEEKAMTYEWYDETLDPGQCPSPPPPGETACKVGDGIVFTYGAPAPGLRDMRLVVRDATLEAEFEDTVCALGPGETC